MACTIAHMNTYPFPIVEELASILQFSRQIQRFRSSQTFRFFYFFFFFASFLSSFTQTSWNIKLFYAISEQSKLCTEHTDFTYGFPVWNQQVARQKFCRYVRTTWHLLKHWDQMKCNNIFFVFLQWNFFNLNFSLDAFLSGIVSALHYKLPVRLSWSFLQRAHLPEFRMQVCVGVNERCNANAIEMQMHLRKMSLLNKFKTNTPCIREQSKKMYI